MNKQIATASILASVSLAMTGVHEAMASVQNDSMVVVGTYETLTVEVSSDTSWDKPVFVAGTLRKTGAGRLTICGEKLYGQGRIEVASGSLEITATGQGSAAISEPAILRSGAAMWLDAGVNVAGTDGAAATGDVANWYDVRETGWNQAGFSPDYIYAQSCTNLAVNEAFPQTGADDAGRDFIYFGGFGSGRWMQWRNPDGTKAWLPIYHSFHVYNPLNAHGHFLGCSKAENGESREAYFGAGTSTLFLLNAPATNLRDMYNPVRLGRVFRDGVKVPASAKIELNALQLLETESPYNSVSLLSRADAFFAFKDYQSATGTHVNGNRLGGGRLHEVAVFTNRISEVDRILVEQYLLRKWVNNSGYSLPSIAVAPAAVLTMPSCLADSAQIDSDGTVEWDGGNVPLRNAADPFRGLGGAISFADGTMVSNDIGAAVAPVSGKAYASDDCGTVTQTNGDSDTVAKTGSGPLAFSKLDAATRFNITQGEASLRAVPTNAVNLSANCIADGGFEGIYSGTSYQNYDNGAAIGAWTVDKSGGYVRVSYKTGWRSGGTALIKNDTMTPEGDYYLLFVQPNAAVKQTVNLTQSGRYELTMRVSSFYTWSPFARIYIDGQSLGTVQCRNSDEDWDFARLITPWLSKGEHVIKIVGEYDTNIAIAIDDIRLVWLDDVHDAPVANGHFEDINWAAANNDSSSDFNTIPKAILNKKLFEPAYIPGWTAVGSAYLVRRSPFLRLGFVGPENDNGSFSALLSNGGSLSQTVTVRETGCYRLSALVSRFVPQSSAITATSGSSGTLSLSLGTTSETFTITDWGLVTCRLSNTAVLSAGDQVTVTISADDVSGVGNNIAIDDVQLVLENGNMLANGGFETDGANAQNPQGWTVLARRSTERPIVYKGQQRQFGLDIAEGNARARLHAGTHIAQTVSLAAGLYRLSFWEVSRVDSGHVYAGPSPLCVTLANGATTNFCARVMPSSVRTTFLRHEYLVRIATAGSYTLGIEALVQDDPDEDKSTMLDAVCLTPVRDIDNDSVPAASEDVVVSVATGAKLGLEWPGVLNAKSLRVGGRPLSGTVVAETAPDILYGAGSVEIKSSATVIYVR